MMNYKFLVDELAYCIRIGTQRQRVNEHNRVRSKQFTDRDPTNIHIQGVLAEYAFARLCAQELKLNINIQAILDNTQSRGARRDTFDLTLFGKKIDVKSTMSEYNSFVYAPLHKRFNPADYYVLMGLETEAKDGTPEAKDGSPDEKINAIVKNPNSTVSGVFRGFVSGSILFASTAQLSCYRAKANPSWKEFLHQLKPDVDKNCKINE
jgi:hypothetical protein